MARTRRRHARSQGYLAFPGLLLDDAPGICAQMDDIVRITRPAMPAAPPALEWRRAASLHAERSRSVARELALAQAPYVCRALGHTPRRLQMRARAATMTSDWNAVGSAGGEFVAAVLRRTRTRTAVPTSPRYTGRAAPDRVRSARCPGAFARRHRLGSSRAFASPRAVYRRGRGAPLRCLRRRAEGPL